MNRNKIRNMFERCFDDAKSHTVAGIHGTLLSILAACGSAYLVFTYNAVQQGELKAIDEAERINDINWMVLSCPFGRIEESERFDFDKLDILLASLFMGQDCPGLPKDPQARGMKALGVMASVVGQYPFPERFFRNDEGRFGTRGPAKPVTFKSIVDVRKWVKTMNERTGWLMFQTPDRAQSLPWLLEELGRSDYVTRFRGFPSLGILSQMDTGIGSVRIVGPQDSLDPVAVYRDFMSNLRESMRIARETENQVRRVDAMDTFLV